MEYTDGGVTAAKGFFASSAQAGIKYEGRSDMALIYSKEPCAAAGTFTRNVVKAAPVKWDRAIVEAGDTVNAVVCNSGIANACTGPEGMKYCEDTAGKTAEMLGISREAVLVASTGIIGMQLKMERIEYGISLMVPSLGAGREAAHKAAMAIMTTDTKPKECAVSFEIGGKPAVIGGMCKGSGMIHPNMCTMLSFLTTDVNISKEMLQQALKADVADTYNMISIDGDTSTNDTVLLLANGNAGNVIIDGPGEDYDTFCSALHMLNVSLCRQIAGDGEGATALLEVKTVNAGSKEQAALIARSVVGSNLVKTAVCGHDANWGRIMCAMGYSGADFDPDKVDLFFEAGGSSIQILSNGMAAQYSEEEATRILSQPEITAVIDLKEGAFSATAWGCDLTHGYISINADYRS